MVNQKENEITPENIQSQIDALLAFVGVEQEVSVKGMLDAIANLEVALEDFKKSGDVTELFTKIQPILDEINSSDSNFSLFTGFFKNRDTSTYTFTQLSQFRAAKAAFATLVEKPLEKVFGDIEVEIEKLTPAPAVQPVAPEALAYDPEKYYPPINGVLLPREAELNAWINLLFTVTTGTKPIYFDKEAFEHHPSTRIQETYTKWAELETDVQILEGKGLLPEGYREQMLLIKSKIGFFNLYFDIREPNGANNHQKLMNKILDGNAVQYGPLIGGQKDFDHLMAYYGLTNFEKIKPTSEEVRHVPGDAADTIRKEGLKILAGKYLLFCQDGGRWKNKTESHEFVIGNMGGSRYGELKSAVRTGSFVHDGETVYLVDKNKYKANGNKLTGDAFSQGIDGDLFGKVAPAIRERSFIKDEAGNVTRKMNAHVFDHAWNLISLDLVDIAFIPKRAKGSSLGQGNENLTGGSIKIDEKTTVSCLTDALSYLATMGYEINNKPAAASPSVDGIILYKPKYYETAIQSEPNKKQRENLGPTHPTASSDSPYKVTRFARDTVEYYLTLLTKNQLAGKAKVASMEDIENDPIPQNPSVDIYNDTENERLFWHFDFDPNQPAEFPSLSMALQRRYIDSTGAYYTALNGYLYMRNILFEDLPENMDESAVKEKMANWLSNGAGKYKIIKGGTKDQWIEKTTRLYFTRLFHSYEKNTTFKLKNWGQLNSLVYETVKPLWDATTVKNMSGSKEEFTQMKIDLILDLFEASSTRQFRQNPGVENPTITNNINQLKHHLKHDDEESLFEYLKNECGFKVSGRFEQHNRIKQIVWYNKWQWKKSNFAAPKFKKLSRSWTAVQEVWGRDPKHKPVPPRLLIKKGEKS